jgi:predicted permease
MHHLIQDLRFGFRMLAKTPGFTLVAVLVLAFSIGGTSAMFTLINNINLKPLAAQKPEQLVRIYSKPQKPGGNYRSFSFAELAEFRDRNPVFTDVMGFTITMVGIAEGELTRRSFAAVVSANYFSTFGVRMAAGRSFLQEEERPGSAIPVVVVSHEFWRKTGFDRELVGRTLQINSRAFQVVGITPEFFTGTSAIFAYDFWLPLGMYDSLGQAFSEKAQRLGDNENRCLMLLGRLRPGLTIAAAQAQLQPLAAEMARVRPESNKDYTFELGESPRISINTNPVKDPSAVTLTVLLMGMSGAVLLIACLNLANMLLARGAARRQEMAIRLALGAARGRLVRQMLTEGLLLALLGGACGLVLSNWATRLLLASVTPRLGIMTLVLDARPDARVLAVTFLFCVLSVLIFALGPSLRLSRMTLTNDLKEQVGAELRARRGSGLFAPRNLLVVAQLALSLTLLTGAGLFTHAALKASHANPGFSYDGKILVETDAKLGGADDARAKRIYLELMEQLRGLPGVESASLAYLVPFSSFSDGCTVEKPGAAAAASPTKAPSASDPPISAGFNIIGTDYMKTLGLTLLRGRDFDAIEVSATSASHVAIIDEPLAAKLWKDENPIGRQIKLSGKEPPLEVVGVVSGVRDDLDDVALKPHVYVPFGQDYRSSVNLHLKLKPMGPAAETVMLGTVRQKIRDFDPHLAVISFQSFKQFHRDGILLFFKKTSARIFGAFGILALFLAAVGVYGVKAYVVARRTREIGIRIALGATRENVLWLVLREGLILAGMGLAIGLPLSIAVGLLLRSMIYEVQALDPVTFIATPLCLTGATLLACYLPARRATRVQPMAALRYE